MNRILIILSFILSADYCVAQTAKDSLYVFVGEKISMEEFDARTLDTDVDITTRSGVKRMRIYMDGAFKCRYKVIQNVYNQLKTDTIDFIAFDHYGTPYFSTFKNVLLYISEGKRFFYHQKYQFNKVYLTKDNRWASPGDPYDGQEDIERKIAAVPLKFKKPVIFDLQKFSKENIAKWYAAPYYKVEGNKATALMGNYVEELFIVKKEGVLHARGIF